MIAWNIFQQSAAHDMRVEESRIAIPGKPGPESSAWRFVEKVPIARIAAKSSNFHA